MVARVVNCATWANSPFRALSLPAAVGGYVVKAGTGTGRARVRKRDVQFCPVTEHGFWDTGKVCRRNMAGWGIYCDICRNLLPSGDEGNYTGKILMKFLIKT